MYQGGSLAATGAAVTIAGYTFGLNWMVAIAGGLVVGGVVLYRIGSRRKRYEQA